MFTDNPIIDNMHRQTSRIISNSDTIDCIVNTSDLAFEPDLANQDSEKQRSSGDSRRNQTSKRTNGNSIDRSSRHSPPTVTHKRQSSPSLTSQSTSRSHHHHYHSSQKHRQTSESPPPLSSSRTSSSSSRHHRPSRPVVSVKRPYSKSRSPYDRRPSLTHRSHVESSKKRTSDNEEFTSIPASKKPTTKTSAPKQETTDLSMISEDESIKPHYIRSNSSMINESLSNDRLHSTPSLPILKPISNESLLEISTIPPDCELSLFAKSALSTTNTSSMIASSTPPVNNFIQIIDLISKYKMMQTIPSTNTQIDLCSKEIFTLIQKEIELCKIAQDHRAREMKLNECELAEREKRYNDPSNSTTVSNELPVTVKSIIMEEKPAHKSKIPIDQDIINVSPDESVEQSTPSSIDTLKVNVMNNNGSNVTISNRKNREKSRFSPLIVDPSVFTSQKDLVVDLYSDDNDDYQSASSMNTIDSFKKTVPSKILVITESTKSLVDTDLKVTSSNSCRKVEIQSETIHKPSTNKGSSQDLRFTLRNNRTKQQTNVDNRSTSSPILNDAEQNLVNDRPIPARVNSSKNDKQQSHDYHQQRSVTSASMEMIISDGNDKRDQYHRHQQQHRINNSRQQQPYSRQDSSSPSMGSNERSYPHGSTSQQSSKYGSNQIRNETDDLRPRIFEHKPAKSSRSTHRDNY